ncbi:hypothetical protein F444_16036, partial [Phytophthora nicotianae P1976]
KLIEKLQQRIHERHDEYTEFSIAPSDRLAACIDDETGNTLEEFLSDTSKRNSDNIVR